MSDSTHIVRCWEYRGCHGLKGLTDLMEVECPHARDDCYSPCPVECKYTASCSRPWHETTGDINLVLDPSINRLAAIKKTCYVCKHFLTNGPRVGDDSVNTGVIPETATPDANDRVTLHLF